MLTGRHSDPFVLEKEVAPGWISLLCVLLWTYRAVEMGSFCLLTSMEQIPIPNCSILHLHSYNMKFEKFILEGKKF